MARKTDKPAPALRTWETLTEGNLAKFADLLQGKSPAQQVVDYIADWRGFLASPESAHVRDDARHLLDQLVSAVNKNDTLLAVPAAAQLGEYRFWPGAAEAQQINEQRVAAATRATAARILIGENTASKVAAGGRPVSKRHQRRIMTGK